MRVKSWSKLAISLIAAQAAGFIGTFFTIAAIPTWYASLAKPSFSPPNWIFGPVWTLLYLLIGISMYLIWIRNKKGELKLFMFHLILNAIWSPIFFGLKNLGLALFVILLMDFTLIKIIKNFLKLNMLAAYLLVPYLLWLGFASILNFSIWKLNSTNAVTNIFAQDFTFTRAHEDFVFSQDSYNQKLATFNAKKDSYQKNPTLSLKEEMRIALLDFLNARNQLVKNYLTMLRIKAIELEGPTIVEKQNVYSKIDPEVEWYNNRKEAYKDSDPIEDLISKSREEDSHYKADTLPKIYYSLSIISLGEVTNLQNKHLEIYEGLKKDAKELVTLGRADSSLFERWFKDIDGELGRIDEIKKETRFEMEKIFSKESYERDKSYENVMEVLSPVKGNLLKLNQFIKELETTIEAKR